MLPVPLQVLIVDDEPLARLRLRQLLQAPDSPPATVVGEAGDMREALAVLAAQPCDLVLLDIHLPGPGGLRLAEALRQAPRPPAVVFVSAHAEHALRAFELEAVDYLTKPVRRDRLAMALARVLQRRRPVEPAAATGSATVWAGPAAGAAGAAAGHAPVLVVSDRGRVLRVPVAEVLYLKAEQKYVSLCSPLGRWLLDEPLAELAQRLGPGFLRVHRNAVVAVAAVRALALRGPGDGVEGRAAAGLSSPDAEEGWQLQLSNGDWLAVSRRQLSAVREVLAQASTG